jgi:DNA-directed RNA polymerase specialized sigma24 family protein
MPKHVRIQKTREIRVKKDSSYTEQSAYWDDVYKRGNDDENWREHPQANPDMLPETKIAFPTAPQFVMGEAIEHLQGRQRQVYMLTMRDGKSLAEAAKVLDIEKSSVQKYKERAIRFIQQWCERAMAKGLV